MTPLEKCAKVLWDMWHPLSQKHGEMFWSDATKDQKHGEMFWSDATKEQREDCLNIVRAVLEEGRLSKSPEAVEAARRKLDFHGFDIDGRTIKVVLRATEDAALGKVRPRVGVAICGPADEPRGYLRDAADFVAEQRARVLVAALRKLVEAMGNEPEPAHPVRGHDVSRSRYMEARKLLERYDRDTEDVLLPGKETA